ncbi:MAG: kelch repeat-containing protein, partial [Thermoplasmata archaeon]|nr:kelch repeat-containing protein [Thermoplasmata archaeon]
MPRPWVCIAVLFLTVLVPTLPGVSGTALSSSPVPSVPPANTSSAAGSALETAITSLGRGVGPAFGSSLSCAPTGAGRAQCTAPVRPHPLSSTGSKGWTNVTGGANGPTGGFGGAGMTFDPPDNETVLFGGLEGPAYGAAYSFPVNSTYLYRGGNWSGLTGTAPSARWAIVDDLTYDAKDGYVLLFGGRDGNAGLSDTWKFSGGNWTDLTSNISTSPPGRYAASMTYDA